MGALEDAGGCAPAVGPVSRRRGPNPEGAGRVSRGRRGKAVRPRTKVVRGARGRASAWRGGIRSTSLRRRALSSGLGGLSSSAASTRGESQKRLLHPPLLQPVAQLPEGHAQAAGGFGAVPAGFVQGAENGGALGVRRTAVLAAAHGRFGLGR